MRRHLLAAVISALPVIVPAAASAAVCFGPNPFFCRDPFDDPFGQEADRRGTLFDLGVDVSNVPLTRQGANQFLATLSPEGQHIMVTTCRNYLGNPSQVQSARTIQFCRALIGG